MFFFLIIIEILFLAEYSAKISFIIFKIWLPALFLNVLRSLFLVFFNSWYDLYFSLRLFTLLLNSCSFNIFFCLSRLSSSDFIEFSIFLNSSTFLSLIFLSSLLIYLPASDSAKIKLTSK